MIGMRLSVPAVALRRSKVGAAVPIKPTVVRFDSSNVRFDSSSSTFDKAA
jgi:hypothetical protein